ncbi:MAG: MlaD family protein [Nitrospiraceae bacterium]|nr:MlaD family protein [Nitrospiraceae bacterium]
MFDLKKQVRWAQIKSGIIISIALLILFLGVFFAGSIERLINPKVRIETAIADVKGLKKGAPVWVYGIEEGSVEDISLDPKYGTVVTISVYKKVLSVLKMDATASVLTMGLLGDKYVELNPGTPNAAPLAPGAMIRGTAQIDLKDVMETGGQSIKKVTEFIDKMGNLVEKLETSKGTFSRFLEDPALYDNLKESSKNLAVITADIRGGRGTIGLLVKDPSLYERLSASSKSMEEFSRKLDSGSGTLNKLLTDDRLYAKLVGAASSAEEFGKKLNSSSGTIGKLIEDPELYQNLTLASKRLSLILERIEKGEGAAGVLVSDDQTAQELKETVKELRMLTEDIRKEPSKYFKFSLF